jgi:hypothetical protein
MPTMDVCRTRPMLTAPVTPRDVSRNHSLENIAICTRLSFAGGRVGRALHPESVRCAIYTERCPSHPCGQFC